ncbi:MAG: response regulator [Balneolaceae bacterium]|nr:MAG: response regulator [Balneolaceae bacterium]
MKNTSKICIIDDDEIFVIVAKKIMKVAGFSEEVKNYKNGKDAITYLKENASNEENIPEFIFLDLNMPLMDGWEFLHELEKLDLSKKVKVFIFTSSIDPEDQKRSEEFSIVERFIEKPLTMQKLKLITEFEETVQKSVSKKLN